MLTWKDRLLGLVPFCIYIIVYYIEVVVIGESNGGWQDVYHIIEYISPAIAIPVLLLLSFGVSTFIALLSNYLTKKRKKKMYLFWREELDPIEVRIEAYGLGRMAGQYSEKNNIEIPFDILVYLAERYHLKTEDLMKPFVKGLLTELKDRDMF